MKAFISLLSLFLVSLNFTAQASLYFVPDSLGDVDLDGQTIVYHDQQLGKVETKVLPSSDEKLDCFQITVFKKDGKPVAEYNVEVLKSKKGKQDAILFAQVKTLKDKVVHNGTNFIESRKKKYDPSQDATLQLKQMIGYLRLHRYL